MSGGWKGSSATNRRNELPPDWEAIREHVLDRDDYRCTAALPSGAPCPHRATDVDHVGSKWDNSPGNLTSLCAIHHGKKTARQGNDAKKAKRPTGGFMASRRARDRLR